MALVLKFLVVLGGATGLVAGIFMLVFFEKFMEFNNLINRNFLVGSKYIYSDFGADRWLFAKSYLTAVGLIVIGLFLLTQFARYAPY
jgi:hypothetical protein